MLVILPGAFSISGPMPNGEPRHAVYESFD
jgi:hypothetical protein